jgi:hypothetical protein
VINNNNNSEIINVKSQILNMVNNITCSISCKYRISATLYTLETLVCFRHYIQIIAYTLTKVEKKMMIIIIFVFLSGSIKRQSPITKLAENNHNNNNSNKLCMDVA